MKDSPRPPSLPNYSPIVMRKSDSLKRLGNNIAAPSGADSLKSLHSKTSPVGNTIFRAQNQVKAFGINSITVKHYHGLISNHDSKKNNGSLVQQPNPAPNLNSVTMNRSNNEKSSHNQRAFSQTSRSERIAPLNNNNKEEKYLRREIVPTHPPADLQFSVFAIYENGNSYDSRRRAYGMPKGMGVLLNENLCLTAGEVFKDESSAINSFIQLKDGSRFKLDPYRAFVSIDGQFAVTGIKISEARVLETFLPIDIKKPFELFENDSVFYFPFDTSQDRRVLSIDEEIFTFSSGKIEYLLPGCPIFTVDWVIQGIYISSEQHINKVLKMKSVLSYLESSIYLLHNPLLDKFINQDDTGFVEKFHDRHLYYFEWGTSNIWRYDIDKKNLSNVKIHNYEEFSQENPDWSFGVNSRLVYLPSSSIICIGGVIRDTKMETREIFEFCPQEYQVIKRLPDMRMPRDGPACVYAAEYIYALGGLPHARTCEKYSIASLRWLPIASMYYPRNNASASSMLGSEYIFILGGDPAHPSGSTIEKYSIKFDHWELLVINLPKPMSKIGLFPITNRRLAILGGTESNHIFILNINDVMVIEGVNYSTQNEKDSYTLQDCLRPLENITETVMPVAFSRTHNVLYIMNSYQSAGDYFTFGIDEFNVEYFDISTHADYSDKPANLIARVRTPYELGRTWKNDTKLRMLK